MRVVGWVGASFLLLLLAVQATGGVAMAGNRFPVTERTYYLTGTADDVPSDTAARQLQETVPANQGTQNYIAPGIDLLGVIQTPATYSWYSQTGWDKDLEIVDDLTVVLYFTANPQGLNGFSEVRLYDVAPDGQANLVDSNQQQFVTALSSTPVNFPLHSSGVVVLKGHILRLEVFTQTGNAAVVLQFGGSTPSGIHHLLTRWYDQDGDGVPDSDEVGLNRNPLDPSDPSFDGADGDKDGLTNAVETSIGTKLDDNDTDDDGFGDGLEVHAGSDPLDSNSRPYDVNQNGLPDNFETNYFSNTTFNNGTTVTPTTGPCTPGQNCVDPNGDPDGDGCNNLCEAVRGTDPNDADTDNDGVNDGEEVDRESDPLSPSGAGEALLSPEPLVASAMFGGGTSLILLALLRRI